jgi:hypothetical protein
MPQSPSRSRERVVAWLKRYGPAECVGILTALAGAYGVHAITQNEIAAAYGGAIGETLGFYSVIVAREIRADARAAREQGRLYSLRAKLKTAANLMVEFGPAEIVDSGLIRPAAMGVATHYLGRSWGVPLGKLAADVTFYVPVIATFELRRWLRRARGEA